MRWAATLWEWALAGTIGCAGTSEVSHQEWGRLEEKPVYLFTLKNAGGIVARVTNYGTILTQLHVPDRRGKTSDVVLGFDSLAPYLERHPYFGCTVGRVANRIAKARFVLEGKEYRLTANNGPNHIHGGIQGFDRAVWDAEAGEAADGPSVTFRLRSAAGEEGYPGNLDVTVVYVLTHRNELRIEMAAVTDAPTIVNLAHHTYWNLAGHESGDVLGHELALHADRYTPADDALIPTGEIAPVEGTPFDFRRPRSIGLEIGQVKGGYDTNFVVNGPAGTLRPAARLKDPVSGRAMELSTTEPGVQFYSGNFLDGSIRGKGGIAYRKHQGLCLETQKFPDAANKPGWPPVVLRPGETYRHVMVHRFLAE